MGPRVIDLGSPVNWNHPLNRGLVYWNLILPNQIPGVKFPNLAGKRFDLTASGARAEPTGLGYYGFALDGSAGYAENLTAPPVANVPASAECVFRSADTASTQALVALNNGTGTSNRLVLLAAGATGGDPIQATTNASTTAASSAGYQANTLHHACGVWPSSTDRRAFLDGRNKGTNATSQTVAGSFDRLTVGARWGTSSLGAFFNGLVASVRIYNRALADDEVSEAALQSRRRYPDLLNWYVPKTYSFGYVAPAAGDKWLPNYNRRRRTG